MDDQQSATPAEAAAILAELRADGERVERATTPDPRLVYGAWGTAWLVGFLLLFAGRADASPVDLPLPVAGVGFGALVVAAMVVTGVHMARRFAGVRGASSTTGAMYGWAWSLSFAAYVAVALGVQRAGAPDDVTSLVWSCGSGLVVGALYLAGAAIWQDRVQFGLGAWILACSGAGALVGSPGVYLVMGLAGGGGFLAAAAVFAARGVR